jgi:hypothetical protein
LDHAVVQIHADALALFEHAQLLHLLVQARVFNRDCGVRREQFDQVLVLGAELLGAALVGQVQVADGAALVDQRHAQETGHGRWCGGNPTERGVLVQVAQAQAVAVFQQDAEQAQSARVVPDARFGLGRHARGDELGQEFAQRVRDAQGRVTRVGQFCGSHNALAVSPNERLAEIANTASRKASNCALRIWVSSTEGSSGAMSIQWPIVNLSASAGKPDVVGKISPTR